MPLSRQEQQFLRREPMAITVAGTFEDQAAARLAIERLRGGAPLAPVGVRAAGPGGAARGAASGGLIDALFDAGVAEKCPTTNATHIERGHALVTVRTGVASAPQVRDILAHAGALHLYP